MMQKPSWTPPLFNKLTLSVGVSAFVIGFITNELRNRYGDATTQQPAQVVPEQSESELSFEQLNDNIQRWEAELENEACTIDFIDSCLEKMIALRIFLDIQIHRAPNTNVEVQISSRQAIEVTKLDIDDGDAFRMLTKAQLQILYDRVLEILEKAKNIKIKMLESSAPQVDIPSDAKEF